MVIMMVVVVRVRVRVTVVAMVRKVVLEMTGRRRSGNGGLSIGGVRRGRGYMRWERGYEIYRGGLVG